MKRFFVCAAVFAVFALCFAVRAFAAPAVTVVDIGIAPEDYEALIADEEKQTFAVQVQTDGGGYTAAQVNIRGNSSRMIGQLSKAKRVPLELSFESASAFPGLENTDVKLINCFTPYRLVAEYLALELFSECGVPTPEHTFAFVRINDVDLGLYIAVEDVNKGFVSRQYGTVSPGALYKATMDDLKRDRYIDSEWFGHLFQKGKASSETLSLLLAALDGGEGYGQYINADEWLRYFACVAVTGGDGSIFTERNNFALYDNGGRFDLIPWDLSEAFSGRKTTNGIDRYYIRDDTSAPNPLFDLIMRDDALKQQYHGYISAFAGSFFEPASLDARYTAVVEALAPYLPRDRSVFLNTETAAQALLSDAPDGYLSLRYTLQGLSGNLTAQLEGREFRYFASEALAPLYATAAEDLVAELESASPLYDPKLPQKIVSSYRRWQRKAAGESGLPAGRIAAGCGIVLVCAAVPAIMQIKKKRRHKV